MSNEDSALGLQDPVLIAREIQKTARFTTYADIINLLVMHGDGTCTLLNVTFDHTKLNGMDVCQILKKQSEEVMNVFFSETVCVYWQDPCHKHLLVPQVIQVRIRFLE